MSGEDTAPRELVADDEQPARIEDIRVSVLDLSGKQVQAIERTLRLPFSKWKDAPSTMELLYLVLAAGSRRPVADFQELPLRQLRVMVSLDGETDQDP